MMNYWTEHLRRWHTWAGELAPPTSPPAWTTPNVETLRLPLASLRCFGSDRTASAPWVVVNPNAGHHSMIGDYAPGQSLVEVLLEHGGGAPVFAVEWLPPTLETRHATIDDYLLTLDAVVGHARRAAGTRRVRLLGLCQGGWLSAMLAALVPDVVENLILAAAPIDFRAGEGKLTRAVESLGLHWYENLVLASGGVMPGKTMLLSWKLLDPVERFLGDALRLWDEIGDGADLSRQKRFRHWYEWTQDLPGPFYLQVVRELFSQNLLVRGAFRAFGEPVDLRRIHCPVSTIAGLADDITLPEQLEAVAQHVSSPTVRHRRVAAGHIGVFMKGEVVRQDWPELVREAMADSLAHFGRVRTLAVSGVPTLSERGLLAAQTGRGRIDGLLLAACEDTPWVEPVELCRVVEPRASPEEEVPVREEAVA